MACKVGNTVQCDDELGVLEVLSLEPLSTSDGDRLASEFVIDVTQLKESFDDFAGLPRIVERAKELIELPLLKQDLLSRIGAPPVRGVLMTGGPGTGKTMLARIIARASGATLYLIRGPEIAGRYYGQSEDLLRRIFDEAEQNAPAIILLDEIDSVAPARNDDSNEVSRRVVGQLLSMFDGVRKLEGVILVATTNMRENVDPALLRPGRIDWEIPFGVPDFQGRVRILDATRPPGAPVGLPLELVAKRTENWTPAELRAIWTEASLLAAKQDRAAIAAEDFVGGQQRRDAIRKSAHSALGVK